MENIETYLSGLSDFELYGSAFVIYFAIAVFLNVFLFKRKFDFKRNLISALVGLLFFVGYVTFFGN